MALTNDQKTSLLAGLAALIGFSLPISTAFDNITVGLFLLVWLVTGDWRARWRRLSDNPASYAIGALLALAALGMFWGAGNVKENIRYFEKYAGLILALALFTLPLDRRMRQRALIGFATAALLTAVVSFAFKLGLVPAVWFPTKSPTNPTVFKLHITHGFFVAIGAYIFLVNALEATDPRWRAAFGVAAAITAANVLVVEGRIGYLILAILMIYLFVQHFRWRGVLASLVLIVVAISVAAQFPESAVMRRMTTAFEELHNWQRGEHDDLSSTGTRLRFATTSVLLIAEHPVLGVGTGGYEVAYRAAVPEGDLVSNNPHNQYLLTTVQLGLPGLLVLLSLFVVLWRLSGGMSPSECLLARGFLLAYLVGNLFNSFLYDHAETRFFALAVGLIFCGAEWKRSSDRIRNY